MKIHDRVIYKNQHGIITQLYDNKAFVSFNGNGKLIDLDELKEDKLTVEFILVPLILSLLIVLILV